MNWKEIKEIKEKYTEGWQKWVEYNGGDKESAISNFRWYPRRLYDFFDEQEIYIEITYWQGNDWAYAVFVENKDLNNTSDLFYKGRTDCEERAFLKAFEILESRINY